MKLGGGDVVVESGAGLARDGVWIPLVVMTVERDGKTVVLNLPPDKARRIGLDLIAGAGTSWWDAGVRGYARQTGQDGDSILASVRVVIKETLAKEEPA